MILPSQGQNNFVIPPRKPITVLLYGTILGYNNDDTGCTSKL